jgi:hypothetical protein
MSTTARVRLGAQSIGERLGVSRQPRRDARPLAIAAGAAALGAASGALLVYFFDPRAGRRRRHTAPRARRAESHALGIARRTANAARRRHREALDDVTLTRKVETELYARVRVPKGRISINAEDGCVFLRGVLDRQDDIDSVAAAARHVRGVRQVENLIHLPGTPAPASRPKSVRATNGAQ